MALDETRRTLLYGASTALSLAISLTHRAVMNQNNVKESEKLWQFYKKLNASIQELGEITKEESAEVIPAPKVLGAFDSFLSNCVNDSINGGSER